MNSLYTALSSIRRSPYQALVAVLTMTVTFAVLFSLSFFFTGAQLILRYYESKPQIIAFFNIDATADQISTAQKTMETKPYVSEVSITTKEQALELYSQQFKESPLLLELVTADILPASIEVSSDTLENLAQVKKDLDALAGIENVQYQESVIDTLRSWTATTRFVGITAAVVFVTLAFLVIMVIIGMRVSMQKRNIGIIRLLGASKWYVQRPFMYEGMLYGITGAVLGWGASFAGLLYILPWAESFLTEVPIFPIPVEFYGMQLGVGILISLVLGGFAGLVAASRLIKN
jgi:cell division transport system permease protein